MYVNEKQKILHWLHGLQLHPLVVGHDLRLKKLNMTLKSKGLGFDSNKLFTCIGNDEQL